MTKHLRVVITGVDGFVGRHVAELAKARGHHVIGLSRAAITEPRLLRLLDDAVEADLTKEWPESTQADAVVHLAGLSAVGASFDSPQDYIETNSRMMTHLGEHMLKKGETSSRIVVVSSGSVYASESEGMLSEQSPTRPSSPYAVSKLLIEAQAEYYAARGVDMIIARPFNHIGPGQGPGFLIPDLAQKVLSAESGAIAVGDLSTRRDYTDVRDVAGAYLDIIEAPRLDDRLFNICSGRSLSGYELLRSLASSMGVPEPETYVDPAWRRPVDAAEIVGDASRLKRQTGWKPVIPMQKSVADFVVNMSGAARN